MDFQHAAAGDSAQQRVHLKPEVILLHPVQYAKLSTLESSSRWVEQTAGAVAQPVCMQQQGYGLCAEGQLASRVWRLGWLRGSSSLGAHPRGCSEPPESHKLETITGSAHAQPGRYYAMRNATTSGLSPREGPHRSLAWVQGATGGLRAPAAVHDQCHPGDGGCPGDFEEGTQLTVTCRVQGAGCSSVVLAGFCSLAMRSQSFLVLF